MPLRIASRHSSRILARVSNTASSSPTRSISNTPPTMVNVSELSVSEGHDAAAVTEGATRLIDHGKWKLCSEGRAIEREFKFKTFRATWDFMNAVAGECKKTRHHPEWSNVYNSTKIRWTTHSPSGLSSKDTAMARFCDEAGERFGEIQPEASAEGGGCCGKM